MRQSERGAVFILGMLLVPILMVLATIILQIGFASVAKGNLERAAEAVGFAAGAVIAAPAEENPVGPGGKEIRLPCLKTECWDAAQSVPLSVINRHQFARGFAGTFNLNLTAANQIKPNQWQQSGITVTIERGRWLGVGFESMEDDVNWQAEHPGIPRGAAFNAVRIELIQEGTTFSLPGIRTRLSAPTQRVELVVTAGGLDEVRIAPFAIPVCALYSSIGENDPKAWCHADRIFAETGRYSSEPTLPEFHYEVGSYYGTYLLPERLWFGPAARGSTWRNLIYWQHFPTYAFHYPMNGELGDHYGVVGLPGAALLKYSLTEQGIRQVVNKSDMDLSAFIGDDFRILAEGLTTSRSDTVVWKQISDQFDQTPDPLHPTFADTPLVRITPIVPMDPLFVNLLYRRNYPLGPPNPEDRPRNRGSCNSKRFGYDDDPITREWDYTGSNDRPALSEDRSPWWIGNSTIDTPLWHTVIPVIGEEGTNAPPCAGVEIPGQQAATSDPLVDPYSSGGWKVIGFVAADIFDVDIGNDPPPNRDRCYWRGAPMSRSTPCQPVPVPFGFTVDGVQRPCNVVRARVRCKDRSFIATSVDHEASIDPPRFVQFSVG